MKEGFTFNYASLTFLRKVVFKNFGGGGGVKQKRAELKTTRQQTHRNVTL